MTYQERVERIYSAKVKKYKSASADLLTMLYAEAAEEAAFEEYTVRKVREVCDGRERYERAVEICR